MSRSKLWLAFGLIFIAGLISGWSLGGIFSHYLRHEGKFRKNPDKFRNHLLEKISSKLDLSADQKLSFSANFTNIFSELQGKHRQIREETTRSIDAAVENIRPPLSPVQQQLFAEHKIERAKRFQEMDEKFK